MNRFLNGYQVGIIINNKNFSHKIFPKNKELAEFYVPRQILSAKISSHTLFQ